MYGGMIKLISPLRHILLFLAGTVTIVLTTANSHSLPVQDVMGEQIAPAWRCGLTSNNLSCSNLSQAVTGNEPSPVLADMNNDTVLDVIVATGNGRIIAISHNNNSEYGSKLFDVDIAPAFGMAANSQKIDSSPAVADIDNDGRPEVVVGAGREDGSNCYKGGVIVLEHDGTVKPNWPIFTTDHDIAPSNCPDPAYSSPALGDLDNDGDLEIVAASFDKRIYAWHHDGTPIAGFPPDSKHYERFGWPILQSRLADTIWGSPSLADLNGDDYLDIVIGTDEGNFDERWGGDASGWVCPYEAPPVSPWVPGYCGGTVYGLDRFGHTLPGFHIRSLEIMQSTPAIYDVDEDGDPEIFMGTGSWYFNNSPDHPTNGFRIFGWDHEGNELPGWIGGKVLGGVSPAAPAVGDIDGDGDPEIVALSLDKKLYAWHHTGSSVSGFPMFPRDQIGQSYGYNVGLGPVLADYTGNGAMEIFISTGWAVTIVNGSGNQLTASSFPPPNGPLYFANGTLGNIPAIGDVDGDGELELVVNNSNLYVWDLPGSGGADWPMFKQNAAGTGYAAVPLLTVSPDSAVVLSDINSPAIVKRSIFIRNLAEGFINWAATSSQPSWATVSPSSGTVSGETDNVTVTIDPAGRGLGDHQATITINGGDVPGSPQTVTIILRVLPEVHRTYLPATQK